MDYVRTARCRIGRTGPLVCALLVMTASSPLRGDETFQALNVDRDMIARIWKEREERVTSAQFEWTEVRTTTKKLLMPGETLAEPDAPQYQVQSSLSLKADQIRHTFRKSMWPQEAPRGENQYVSVSNGKVSKVYLPPGHVTNFPRGHESRIAGSNDVTWAYLKPFLWCFRPSVDDVLVAPLAEFQVTGDTVPYQGHECVVLRHQAAPASHYDLWVDPSRGFVIVRQQFMNDGHLSHELDVDYEQDAATDLWIPHHWRFALLSHDGEPTLSVNGQLSRADINPDIPDTAFKFEFPPGTWVQEDGSHEHIVMANGKRQMISMGDRGLPYETLLSRKPPSTSTSIREVWIKINIVVLSTACLGLFARWCRTRSHH